MLVYVNKHIVRNIADIQRTKKIRCDILTAEGKEDGENKPICAHCKQYDLECTFFLPITETRFKKRKQASTWDV